MLGGVCSLRNHANRASLEQDQIGSRRTGAAHSRGPRGAALDVHYPAPAGSDTLCRELVDVPIGETDTSGRLRAVAELTLDFSVHLDLLSRDPLPFDLLSHAVWLKGPSVTLLREEDRELLSPRCLPSVRKISEEVVGSARWTRQSSRPPRRVEPYPQFVPNLWTRIRASFILQHAGSDEADMGKELDTGDDRFENRCILPVTAAP